MNLESLESQKHARGDLEDAWAANFHATKDKGCWDSGFDVYCCTPAQCSTALLLHTMFTMGLKSMSYNGFKPSARLLLNALAQGIGKATQSSARFEWLKRVV
eukprot:1093927-Pelagomonas_calceolata.AAC.1